MTRPLSPSATLLTIVMLALALAGCATSQPPPSPPPVEPTLPPAFPPEDLVGRWGLTAYHNEEDRARTELAAANQCRQPYVVALGQTGGVMMHLADQATPTELRLKGSQSGKTFIGPADQPPGSAQDREFIVFNGREMILRWMDSEVQSRYGTMVYVRCVDDGGRAAKPKSSAKPKPKAKTAPQSASKPAT